MSSSILCICGSLRSGSINRLLLNEIGKNLSNQFHIEDLNIDADLPMFNEDLIERIDHSQIFKLKNAIKNANGIIISTPEYNGSIPGALKNLIDWVSFKLPNEENSSYFKGKKIVITSASPSIFRGMKAIMHLNSVLFHLKANVFPETISIQINRGQKIDETTTDSIQKFSLLIRSFFS